MSRYSARPEKNRVVKVFTEGAPSLDHQYSMVRFRKLAGISQQAKTSMKEMEF